MICTQLKDALIEQVQHTMSAYTWNGITFEEHFDKRTLEFMFSDGSRQKVYSRLITHPNTHSNLTTNHVVRSWNPEVIPASLKQTVFDDLIKQ
jgi:hypothetical protein